MLFLHVKFPWTKKSGESGISYIITMLICLKNKQDID